MRATTSPNASRHDEVEFALFDATWRASLESSVLLKDLLGCANSKEASAGHRVTCGLLALKVASHLNELETMRDVYRTIVPLVDSLKANSSVRPEIDMVFHSACGDIGKLIFATKEFLDAIRSETNPLTFSRGVVNAATAYRLAGEKAEAETLLREGLDHALAHGLSSRAIFACYSLVRLYLAAGDTGRAREALDRSELLADFGEDIHLISDRNYLQARVALEEGNIEAASSHYALTLAETNPDQSVNRRSSVRALGIMVGISKGLPIDFLKPLVDDLESMHIINRASGWQDFEAQALLAGLRACGEPEKGLRLLTEYATTYRRERWPLPAGLNKLLHPSKRSLNEADLQESDEFRRAAV
jgi:tetratricopeptide (TPR) repeat protein